jgi:hypothetical protein
LEKSTLYQQINMFSSSAVSTLVLLSAVLAFDYKSYCGTQSSSSTTFSACQTKIRNLLSSPVNNRLSIGSSDVVAFVTAQYYELDGTFQSFTSQFFPVVDDYTSFKVPNITLWSAFNPHFDVTFMAKNENNVATLYKTDVPKHWFNRTTIVPYRSIIVTMTSGIYLR